MERDLSVQHFTDMSKGDLRELLDSPRRKVVLSGLLGSISSPVVSGFVQFDNIAPYLQSRHEVWTLLGRGSYAFVHLAREAQAARGSGWVALKEVPLLGADGGPARVDGLTCASPSDFLREANAMIHAAVHGVAPPVRGCWVSDTAAYIASDLMPTSLADIMLQRSLTETEVDQVVKVFIKTSELGILYTDARPQNLMFNRGGNLKIVDWGSNGFTTHPSTSVLDASQNYDVDVMRIASPKMRMKYVALCMERAADLCDEAGALSDTLSPQALAEALATLSSHTYRSTMDRIRKSAPAEFTPAELDALVEQARAEPQEELSEAQFQNALAVLMLFDFSLWSFEGDTPYPLSPKFDTLVTEIVRKLPAPAAVRVWRCTGRLLSLPSDENILLDRYDVDEFGADLIERYRKVFVGAGVNHSLLQ